MAVERGHKDVYIFGFDYQGESGKFNNVYADTPNYRRSSEPATYFGNWANQTEKVIREFPSTNYIRVIEKNTFVPDNIRNLTQNFQHKTFEDLLDDFPGAILI